MSSKTEIHLQKVVYGIEKVQQGDLLEFKRVGYSHVAVYAGGGKVIHRTEDRGGRVKTKVREDNFWDVAGDDRITINNHLDKTKTPFPGRKVVQRARSKLGNVGYSILFKNCEHFANWCRYGVNYSPQVEAAGSYVSNLIVTGVATGDPVRVAAGASLGALMGLVNSGSALFTSS